MYINEIVLPIAFAFVHHVRALEVWTLSKNNSNAVFIVVWRIVVNGHDNLLPEANLEETVGKLTLKKKTIQRRQNRFTFYISAMTLFLRLF